ncbi:MAG TPA: DM13 domain-containing protein [Chroococcidiopsis sp.]
MKLAQLAFLGATSLILTTLPVASYALPVQSVAQSANLPAIMPQLELAQTPSTAIATGTFTAGEAPTTGTARVVTEGGHRYLEFDAAFSTSSQGPDLHVLLDTNARPPQAYDNLGGAINLGALHDYTGAQRYPIPDSIDLSNYSTVVVWCRMANATFGYAPLRPATSASR